MGKPEKLITAECYNCKDIVIPIDEDVKDEGKKVYSCPSCGSTFHIEFTIEYEEEEPKNDTKHWQLPYNYINYGHKLVKYMHGYCVSSNILETNTYSYCSIYRTILGERHGCFKI